MGNHVIEVCPHCDNEVWLFWDVEADGLHAFCPYCGKRLMLCSECPATHTDGGKGCDYDSTTDKCSMQRSVGK
ncbi:MAG: hypothetical protein IJ779_03495 [Ruminococcus sp.]|nr:hypothetical protein [Ruminococcus sp.]